MKIYDEEEPIVADRVLMLLLALSSMMGLVFLVAILVSQSGIKTALDGCIQ